MRSVLVVALLAVTLLPLVVVGGVVLVGRRLSHAVVAPLGDITRVMEQLRSGQEDARAVVAGPEEIRQIAAGLNLLTEENLRASEVEADVLAQLHTIDKVRTDLVSTVSHELRTPLASIKGYLELLQDELLDTMTPQQSSMVGAMRRNLDRLNELIVNLLALSRAEETALAVEPVDLRGIAIEVAADIKLTAASRDVSIRTVQPAGPVEVFGDRSQLIRAVQNLVTNAVKFSRPGGTVELRVSEEESELGPAAVLEVVDEGIGIPASDLPGLGSRFYRASNAVKAEIAGTGLGLRIVQTILDRHGGSLSVDSVEGEGSTFAVRLPTNSDLLELTSPVVDDGPALEDAVLD
jgi:signal transduction histidine kinase